MILNRTVRIQIDYTFNRQWDDVFTVTDALANPKRQPLVFTAFAEQESQGLAEEGETAYFRFHGHGDDYQLDIMTKHGSVVDTLFVSDLMPPWQMALVLAIADIARDSREAMVRDGNA